MKSQLTFCSCLPRSGSTLLLNFLAQNPTIHVTPTNALSELMLGVRDTWMTQIAFQGQGLKNVQPRVLSAIRGLITGFYDDKLTKCLTVIDKSRTWVGHIELLEDVLERKVQIIVPIRPVEDILASLEKLHRKAALTEPTYQGPLLALRQTTVGRCHSYLAPEAVLGMVISRLRDALDRGFRDRLLVVPYSELTSKPVKVANWLTKKLGLVEYEYDPTNVKQVTQEDDSVYGIELHKIREGPIEKQSGYYAWRGILQDDFVNQIDQSYRDINDLANSHIHFEE